MKLATLRYLDRAWSGPFPDLDSERTVVLAFAAPSFGAQHDVMIELAAAYPRSAMIGCSTGEIDQTRIRDESIAVAVVQFARTRVRQAEARMASAADGYATGVGFYAYGEISPLGSGKCNPHNQTMTLTVLGEAS